MKVLRREIINITLIISWLYWLRLVVYSKEQHFFRISSWLRNENWFSLHSCVEFSFQKDGNIEKQTKVGSRYKRNKRITSVTRFNEEYITQVSEEIEGRVTRKLSQELSRTASRILGVLSKLDEFLLNPQIRTHSRTLPGTFRNTNVENQGTNEGNSQSDPHPEAGIFRSQTTQNSGPELGHDSKHGQTWPRIVAESSQNREPVLLGYC